MKTYDIRLCGVNRTLPLIPIPGDLAFASFVIISDTELVSATAPALVKKILQNGTVEAVVTAEAKGIALAYEVSRLLGLKRFIVARKSVKSYMDVEDKFRQVNVDGCPMIGAGACGECYRLDDETIIKLYYDRISDDTIAEEKRLAKLAFVLGIPTAISYDIVKVGTRKGVIYELIKAKTLSEIIRADYSKLEEYTKQYAEFCRAIHSTVCTGQNLPDFREVNRADIANIRGITAEEAAALNEFLDFVPDGNTCLHGDLNPNNIMLENGSLCLIDMGEFSRGFAMFDVSRIMFSLHFANGKSGTMPSLLSRRSISSTDSCARLRRRSASTAVSSVTLRPLVRSVCSSPSRSISAKARCIVFGLTPASSARSRTVGIRLPGE